MANWALRGQITWASHSGGPICVQKGRPGLCPQRRSVGARYWAGVHPHKMAAQQWAPMMDTQYRRPIMGVLGSPIMGAVVHPVYICAGCPYPSGNGRPYLSKIWMSISVHIGRPYLSILDVHICPCWAAMFAHIGSPYPSMLGGHICPYWMSISVHIGRPCLSILDVHICPCWAAMFAHVGCPYLSMLGGHVCPCWMSISIHVGRPCLPILEVHICPCWAAMFAHVGCPYPSMLGGHVCPYWKSISIHVGRPYLPILDVQSHPSWKPNHCAWTPESCRNWAANPCCRVSICKKWTSKKDGTQPQFVETHLFRWPHELYASGCPIRVEDDHTELWAPIDLCGHEKRNAWMQVGAHIYAWAHIYKAKKIPTPQRGVRTAWLRV